MTAAYTVTAIVTGASGRATINNWSVVLQESVPPAFAEGVDGNVTALNDLLSSYNISLIITLGSSFLVPDFTCILFFIIYLAYIFATFIHYVVIIYLTL